MKKIMKKDNSYKYVKVGFSWSTYFFGWIPSIYRGDFKSFFKIFILGILTLFVYKTKFLVDFYDSVEFKEE